MADILDRRKTQFVLWRPKPTAAPPVLVIGQFQYGNSPSMSGQQRIALTPVAGFDDLYALDAATCNLIAGQVYHYWFEVEDTSPLGQPGMRVLTTDPFAWTVDWRLLTPRLGSPYSADDRQPAAVVKWSGDQLVPADPAGEEIDLSGDPSPQTLPANNHLVIYELPTAWSRPASPGDLGIGVGTFRDVLALVDPGVGGANFGGAAVTAVGRSYLTELGVNALELLPPADSFYKREWGYDTAHYLAPDAGLGFPDEFSAPTANHDLAVLVQSCHAQGIRFFIDAVMAFAKHEPYQTINFDDFYIADPSATPNDPDARTSRPDHGFRNGFGNVLWRYAKPVTAYDPISGARREGLYPARQFMLTYLTRWMQDFRVDGYRLDSLENVASWDFIQAFRDHARELFAARWAAAGLGAGGDAQMLVVGEELSDPLELITEGRVDALWNDHFRGLVRSAVLGGSGGFENVVRHLIDCRNLGFTDGAQAVNYITSHDVEGDWNIRLYNFLLRQGVAPAEVEKRIKLAFVCLLTAVGIPMILAGEEFADEHYRFDKNGTVDQDGGKQVDPVNFARATEPMRARILAYVSRLVKLRTTHPALGMNDTAFLQVDLNDGKRVFVWQRGRADNPVVVIANFSAWETANPLGSGATYVVPNWPPAPAGRQWHEVTQDRPAPEAGQEPLFAWEAKVYVLA
jgi:pullulanase/glycogen debranching enzyme